MQERAETIIFLTAQKEVVVKLKNKMKRILAILIVLIGFGICANAQSVKKKLEEVKKIPIEKLEKWEQRET
ncbi:MAG: hypothetical protein LBJ63_10675 [Prevotellaceae bacterium]|jgi:hypothetical protein|nr:hypothetical protein [Prevotellaceae bacterium]